MGSKGSAPSPPNYAEIIPIQERSNINQFNYMLGASRINSVTPFGRQTWIPPQGFGQGQGQGGPPPGMAYAGGSATFDEGGGARRGPQLTDEQILGNYLHGIPSGGGAGGPQNISDLPPAYGGMSNDPWTFVQELSPEQQALYDQDLRIRNRMGGIAEDMMGTVSDVYGQPVNFAEGLPQYQNQQYNQQGYNPYGPYQQQDWRGPQYQTNVNSRNDAERAYYNREMAYLNPELNEQERRASDRLAAMGFNVNDKAYSNAMDDVYDNAAKQRAVARNNAIVQGGNEATQELQRGLMTEDPRFRAAQSEGQFGYNAGLGENRFGQQFGQSERQFGFGAGMQDQNAALNYALQRINQQRADRATPMNELSAFRTGGQVQLPGTPGTASTPNLQGIDYLGAANQQYQGQLGQWNANQAQSGNFMDGLFGLGSAFLGAGGQAGGFGKLFS